MEKRKRKERTKRKKIWLIALLLLLFVLLAAALDPRLRTVRYEMTSPKLSAPLRIAQLTDLHSCRYGRDMRNLIRAIEEAEPDLIVLTGDIYDDEMPEDNADTLLAYLGGRYPCFYVTGNHENWTGDPERLIQKVRGFGITVLEGEWTAFEKEGARILVAGVNDPDAPGSYAEELDRAAEACDGGAFTVLLTHRPEGFGDCVRKGFDLILAGHAHGGQWRIPFLVNGLFAPGQGLFPKYAGGLYERDGAAMIVSRGLARESTPVVPRVFNRPELVIVELIPEE